MFGLRMYLFLVVCYFLIAHLSIPQTDFDGPLHLAREMLHGKVGFEEERTWWEMFHRGGRFYLVYAPMVSAVLVPFAAIGGIHAQMPLANTLFILASTVALWFLFHSIRSLRPFADLVCIAYLLGTPMLYSVATGTVWLIIHSQGNLFLLIALLFAWRRIPLGFGFFFALAVACRNGLLCTAPFVLYLLWRGRYSPVNLRRYAVQLLKFGIGAVPPVLVSLLLNRAMTGSFSVSTYQITYQQWGFDHLYGTDYFLQNIHNYFSALPEFSATPPYISVTNGGQAFYVVSPFFFLLLAIRLRLRFYRALLIAAVCGFVPYLFFIWNGSAQFGSRYVSDLFPFLIPLTFSALTGKRRASWVWRIAALLLIAVSIFINVFAAILARQNTLWN